MKISKLIIGIMVLVLVVAAFSLTAPDSMAFDIMGPCGDNLTYFYIEGRERRQAVYRRVRQYVQLFKLQSRAMARGCGADS
jgi:hypothetical protein